MSDEQWLKDHLVDAVPPPSAPADRMAGIAAMRVRRQRILAAGAAAAVCLTVIGVTLTAGVFIGDEPSSGPATGPTESSTPTEPPIPPLGCLKDLYSTDEGADTLESGAVAARLCGPRGGIGPAVNAPAPHDVLVTGLDLLVASVNGQPRGGGGQGCLGGFGDVFLLLVAYRDHVRKIQLNFSVCGGIRVGDQWRTDPQVPLDEFARLLRAQRASTTPPPTIPDPTCATDEIRSAFADPDEMVLARMCVSYANGGSPTNSVLVPPETLATILDGWREAPGTPIVKGPACGPTTPDWILSGVTAWGDKVTIEAECDRPARGQEWVSLPPEARELVDDLIEQAGVNVRDGSDAETAWLLADHWIDAVNARALVSSSGAARMIGRVANGMWVADPWLPDGALNWDLLAASRTGLPGWQEAWLVPARTPGGQATFTIVRKTKDAPWRILSLDR